MREDWISALLRGSFETSIPAMIAASGDCGEMRGSGLLNWDADSGIRIRGVTDGGDRLVKLAFPMAFVPGRLICHSTYVTFSGGNYDGWDVVTDPSMRDGISCGSARLEVIWDTPVTGFALTRIYPGETWKCLRILMGPTMPRWPRVTKTETQNEVFGVKSSAMDWLSTDCVLGRVSARHRTDEWFEVRVEPSADTLPRDIKESCAAIADAFSFILGRHTVIRGYEWCNGEPTVRRVNDRFQKTTKNRLWPPITGMLGGYIGDVEQLLGKGIDFFLSERGRRVAGFLHQCWTSVDNQYRDSIAINCIAVEGLLRIAAEVLGPDKSSVTQEEIAAFRKWLETPPEGISSGFLNRLRGLPSGFRDVRPKDILLDWVRRGKLDMTEADEKAWSSSRNQTAHAKEFDPNQPRQEIQEELDRGARVVNILNRIVLCLIGYSGSYTDYSKPGFQPAKFPGGQQSPNSEPSA